jgi:hypothetical protein
MLVHRCSMAGSALSWSGDRCSTTTYTMPASGDIALKNDSSAPMEPAEPPSPTIGSC